MTAPTRVWPMLLSLGAFAFLSSACTFDPGPAKGAVTSGGGAAGNSGAAGGGVLGNGGVPIGNGNTGAGGATFGGGGPGAVVPIPTDFTPTEVGAFKVGEQINPNGATGPIDATNGCYQIVGVVRDFKGSNEAGGHPDFETYSGGNATPGLVGATLGTDFKPVYASMCEAASQTGTCPYGPQTTTKADFDKWYRTITDTNMAYKIEFIFEPVGNVSTFQSDKFFPLDGKGFGNGPNNHNYGFTTELHTKFMYRGGETFRFKGDDDLWVFINKKLALDLGGLHPQTEGTIDLDAMAGPLGITRNTAYDIELFHAERHTTESHFRVDTNFVFVNCGTIIP
jgi:fibro-slime domain-containing protein